MKPSIIVLVILMSFLLSIRLFFDSIDRKVYKAGELVNITHSFLKEPKKNENGQYFFTSNILISIPLFPRYSYGDTVRIKGVVEEMENDKGKLLVIKNPELTTVPKENPFLIFTSFVRSRIEEVVTTTLPPKESGLFLGIIMGVRDGFDNVFYERLRDAGVLHIIAASGQNISILASILLSSLERFVKRRVSIIFTAILIFVYAALVGFDPPIVRASIMAIISFGAMALGRQNTALLALFVTGWGMVFYNPISLTDISFQLSFLSTLGIITIKPLLDNIPSHKFLFLIKEDFNTTLSAQIATFPFMVSTFGVYSLLTLPVNLLILWTIPFLMTLGVISLILSVFLPILTKPFILASYPMLAYFVAVINFSESFKQVIQIQNLPITFICGYYLIVIVMAVRFKATGRRVF